ncbi:MAG: arylsulfatase [Thermomicrobiales bacterium]
MNSGVPQDADEQIVRVGQDENEARSDGFSRRGVVRTFAAGALAGSLGALTRREAFPVAAQETGEATPVVAAQEGPSAPWWQANSPFLKGVMTAPNLEPAIPHPDWEDQANTKLSALATKAGRKPNIIIFLVDDMGWGDPGCFGGGAAVGAPTPNIDRLAASGLRLTSAYSQPSCTPTRAAMLTGRLPQRSGLTRPTATGEASAGMAGEVTIARLLSDAGYVTGMVGKWHLGEDEGQWPSDVGFDEYFGNLSANTSYHDFRDPEISPELFYNPERAAAMDRVHFIRTTVKGWKDGRREFGEEINLETEPQLEMEYLSWSQDFMRRAVEGDQPFYLYHAMNRTHFKNYPNPEFRGKSPAAVPYKDSVVEVDYVLGEIVKTIRELGQEDNTLIVFSHDNGPEEDAFAGGTSTPDTGHTPFRGAKGTTWEGGVRVATIASWPGTITAGRVSDGLFDLMDTYNTFARLGGVERLPTDRYIDGIDQTSWLLTDDDDRQESNREAIFYWYGQEFYAARWREIKRFEQIMTIGMNPGPSTYGGLANATRSMTSDPTIGWVFNVWTDPKERAPLFRQWVAGPIIELTNRSKLTFLLYPQAPRGVVLNGYIVGGPAGGTLPKAFISALQAEMTRSVGNQPD